MKDLTKGRESTLIIAFALPMLIGNVFQQFYNMVDSWVVGRYVGKEALAAVGTSFPVIFLMIALALGIGMGTNVLVAQFYGAKANDKIKLTIDTAYISLFIMGIALTLIGYFTAEPVLKLLRVPSDVFDQASEYLKIISLGLILTFGYNTVGGILRGLGDSLTPLFMLIAATIINIILDLLFVRSFGWGVAGVAWATVIAQGVSFIGSVIFLNRTHDVLKTDFLHLTFSREIFAKIFKIGLPSGIQQALVSLGIMVMTAIVNGFGTVVLAGFSVASRIDSFVAMPAMNIGMAVSGFTGQNMGAGETKRVSRGFHAALFIGLGITLVLSTAIFFFGDKLIAAFTPNEIDVIAVGHEYLRIIAVFYFLFTIMFVTNGVIRGAGEAIVPMISTLAAMWVVRIPCAIIFSRLWGEIGIWYAMPVGWLIGTIIALTYYKSGRWKTKSVVGKSADLTDV
jgi:putative MATE family efflux protein